MCSSHVPPGDTTVVLFQDVFSAAVAVKIIVIPQMDMRDFKLNTGVLTEGEESDDEGTTDGSSSLSFNDTQEITVPISLCLTIMVG